MDDGSCCAVCAETLEWVAYGPCGHRDVCATCIARLRYVCGDLTCCICKSLSSNIFVTKALGSLTRIINDFSILPAEPKDGKAGPYWFHEDTQAYFDDFDEFKVIKAMCRLSCSVCDKAEADGRRISNRKGKFKNIEQLKDHLSRQHELFFCNLCLESKKVFICEQKLYTQVQLKRHMTGGDSEVDGEESERCGFSGHPPCKFCFRPFYGDNELYFHMSTEHYTCHICQRQQPTLYEYYKDYDDLENHFRRAHFLCVEVSCLEKKFVVFVSEAELKRHDAMEHGEQMSRSKRNAALQLSTCFRYRENQEGQRVEAHVSPHGVSDNQLSSYTSVNSERTRSNILHNSSSSTSLAVPGHRGTGNAVAVAYSGSGQVQGNSLDFRSVLLSGSEFPSLPRTSKRRRRKSKKNVGETTGTIPSATPLHSATPGTSVTPPSTVYPAANCSLSSSTSSSSRPMGSSDSGLTLHSSPISVVGGHSTSSTSVKAPNVSTPIVNGIISSASANPSSLTCSTKDVGSSSSSSLKLVNRVSVPSACGEPVNNEDEVKAANKSLVERIQAGLEFDKDKYAAFKIISKEYRDSEIGTGEYLAYVHQFGLGHLILDLARLCPDPQKKKELMEMHKTSLGNMEETVHKKEAMKKNSGSSSKKGKEKCEDLENCSSAEVLHDNIVPHLKQLKLNVNPLKEEPSPTKGTGHLSKGKSKVSAAVEHSQMPAAESRYEIVHCSNGGGLNDCPEKSKGSDSMQTKKKKKSKSSKFLRSRLGEDISETVVPDLNCSDLASDPILSVHNHDTILAEVRGVWKNNGGRRLPAFKLASPCTR